MPRLAVLKPLAASLLLASLAGCASLQSTDSFLGVITPYRVDIVQGNAVTQEQIALVKPGMTRVQVRDVLGSPLLTDIFHADRWDYVFTIRRQGTAAQSRHVVLVFDGERLKSVEAPPLPTEQEFVASISNPKYARGAPHPLELTEEQRKALPAPAKPEAPASAPEALGPVRTYPPLEP